MSLIFRVLDIETVPDDAYWTRGESVYKLAPGLARGPVSPEGIVLSLPPDEPVQTVSVRALEVEPFPPPQACRVVAISYIDVAFDAGSSPRYRYDRCYSECLWDLDPASRVSEASLLRTFASAMDVPDGQVHLVTWNGRGFDLPVISMRSLLHRIPCRWYYAQKDVRYRYSTEGHCDLMDFMCDFGASRQMKLGDFARVCGLPGKTDMSGDKVSDLYEAAKADPSLSDELSKRVARYCLQDSLQTALGWLLTRYHFGKVDAAEYEQALATFRESPRVREAIDLDWERLRLP